MFGSMHQLQSIQGPADPNLRHSEIEGYSPVSRIGEVVINSFVDGYEFAQLGESLQAWEMTKEVKPGAPTGSDTQIVEFRPHFHEWASVLPGMICLQRKARNATFRNYVSAETATPVISCCALLPLADEVNFYFAGVARSKSVRPIDDGVGPQTDEFFTLAIGGMVTLLNNSGEPVFPGDILEWTFYAEKPTDAQVSKRARTGPRRVSIRVASPLSPNVIGRVLSFGKPGETFDLLLKPC